MLPELLQVLPTLNVEKFEARTPHFTKRHFLLINKAAAKIHAIPVYLNAERDLTHLVGGISHTSLAKMNAKHAEEKITYHEAVVIMRKHAHTHSQSFLVALSSDAWRIVRDCIGWAGLLPLPCVCKGLVGVLKDPNMWTGLQTLDLRGFKNCGPLACLSQFWCESKVTFGKVFLPDTTTDSMLVLLKMLGVRDLTVHSKHITDAGLAHLASLPLEQLDLEFCSHITDAGIAHLAALPLRTLSLSACSQVTDAGLAHLTALPLQNLNLSHCGEVTGVGLAHLAALPLHNLNLRGCTEVRDTGLAHLSAVPLQHLDLIGCSQITDAGLSHLASLPLQYLDLWFCNRVTDAGVAYLAKLPLQHLNIGECKEITDAGLAHLAALPLQHLDLRRCMHVTDAGLAYLSALPLQHLNLGFCIHVTDAGIAHLAALPLQHLNLSHCREVTDSGLAHLAALPLQHLNLAGCRQITDAGEGHGGWGCSPGRGFMKFILVSDSDDLSPAAVTGDIRTAKHLKSQSAYGGASEAVRQNLKY
eukprot:g5143.t1